MNSGSAILSRVRTRAEAEWRRFVPWAEKHRALWPAAAIVAVTFVAYNLTLGSMFDYLRLETPLAYLPLLTLFSIGLGLFTAYRYRHVRSVARDKQVDYLLGVPMILLGLVLITLVPALASTYYWSNRPDVLSMALFAGGLVTIFYGITWFWRLKSSLIFLVLMWPALYLNFIPGLMQSFTNATNSALAQVAHRLPLGVTLTGTEGNVLVAVPHGAPVSVSIGSACSGADSVLGFVLIGAAILTAVTGSKLRKALWMVVGLIVCFVANVVRLTSILGLVHLGHPSFALGGYHAVIGLVLFTIVIALMMRLLGLFGLRPRPDVVTDEEAKSLPAPAPRKPLTEKRKRIVIGAMVGLALVVGLTDRGLAPYAAFQDGDGSPTVSPFGTASAPAGYRVTYQADYPWATQYFGANASFTRYLIEGDGTTKSGKYTVAASSSSVVYADVVRTDDKGSLDAYNLQNCFLFHNYNITTSERIDIGGGVTALLLNYMDPATNARWATVSWAWPILNKGETYYERIALTSSLFATGTNNDADITPSGGFHDLIVGLLNLLNGSHDDPKTDALYKNADNSLRAEAQVLVAYAVSHANSH